MSKENKTITLTKKQAKLICNIIEMNMDWDGGIDEDDDIAIQAARDLIDDIKKKLKVIK